MLDLKELAKQAKLAEPEFKAFYKQHKKRLEKMDIAIHELHTTFTSETDCLQCANCCRSLGPAVTDKDIDRISKALRIKPSEVVARYLRVDEDGDYVFQTIPCPFLMPDNYCAIYPSRPRACQTYPHTNRKKFAQIYQLTVKNAQTCPIAFNVLKGILKL